MKIFYLILCLCISPSIASQVNPNASAEEIPDAPPAPSPDTAPGIPSSTPPVPTPSATKQTSNLKDQDLENLFKHFEKNRNEFEDAIAEDEPDFSEIESLYNKISKLYQQSEGKIEKTDRDKIDNFLKKNQKEYEKAKVGAAKDAILQLKNEIDSEKEINKLTDKQITNLKKTLSYLENLTNKFQDKSWLESKRINEKWFLDKKSKIAEHDKSHSPKPEPGKPSPKPTTGSHAALMEEIRRQAQQKKGDGAQVTSLSGSLQFLESLGK